MSKEMSEEQLDKYLRKSYAVSFYDLSVDVQGDLLRKMKHAEYANIDTEGAVDHFAQLHIGLHKLGFLNMLWTYWKVHQEFKRLKKEAFKEKK